jgi:hypothetical protein
LAGFVQKLAGHKKETEMKKTFLFAGILSMAFGLSACSGAFWTGAGGGTAATGAGYEINAKRQMDRLKDDLSAGRINQAEYDIRKDQIQRMSIAY